MQVSCNEKAMTHRTDSGRLSSWGITAALPSIVVIVATAVIIVIIPIDFGNLCG